MSPFRTRIAGLAFAVIAVIAGLPLIAATSITAATAADNGVPSRALIILTSPSLQTQGMAMVLGNAMQAGGIPVNVLLCDKAGDLALANTQSPPLKPKNVTPEQLMAKLIDGGASVSVCALYLPNSDHAKTDLRTGIDVATPPEMAALMTHAGSRVFSF